MRRFLPFAALFGVALLLGCQDVGTGVVASDGPGPQFNKPFRIDKATCEAQPGFIFDETTGHCHAGEAGDPVVDPGTLLRMSRLRVAGELYQRAHRKARSISTNRGATATCMPTFSCEELPRATMTSSEIRS